MIIAICHHIFVQTYRMYLKSESSGKLQAFMICHCSFILGKKKKCTVLVSDIDNEGGCVVRVRSGEEIPPFVTT